MTGVSCQAPSPAAVRLVGSQGALCLQARARVGDVISGLSLNAIVRRSRSPRRIEGTGETGLLGRGEVGIDIVSRSRFDALGPRSRPLIGAHRAAYLAGCALSRDVVTEVCVDATGAGWRRLICSSVTRRLVAQTSIFDEVSSLGGDAV